MKNNKQKNECQGYYNVSGYTREDGTKVDSYIRNCWKHGGINIEITNEKLDEINNKETITDEDLDLSKGYLSLIISKVCEDCENYLKEKENKSETLTLESVEKAKTLDKVKDNILDNIEKSMFTANKNRKNFKEKMVYGKHK